MCRILNTAIRRGLTAATAQWICQLAQQLGVSEREMLKAVLNAASHGVWLGEEEWRLLANTNKRRLAKLAGEVARLVKQGYTAAEALDVVALRRGAASIHAALPATWSIPSAFVDAARRLAGLLARRPRGA
ncbi:hypothetical protein ODS41_13150 [Pyrobaculum sp. 3827-6]|uniref:hypothetical protein n=1 Tax=Pyrobaculum sp. 3827-6 TaxID=2983604 RepID=UPI0021DAFC1A|nr:hypothetical protein [Pyrobaculum sp. 3827-6]MCU7788859.1 hypothetical protein [Pyrobaculum sp. 3827-6]